MDTSVATNEALEYGGNADAVGKQPSRTGRKARRGMQTSKACARCRTLKLKCDASRPCSCCIKKGCAASCVDWDATRDAAHRLDECVATEHSRELVERPISWHSCASQPATNHAPVGFEIMVAAAPRDFMRLMLRKVFSAERIEAWVSSFGDAECESMVECLKLGQMTNHSSRQTMDRKALPSVDVTADVLLEEHAGVAYQCWKLAGNSCSVNEGYCRMMASHPEEVAARWHEHDLSHVFTDLDALAQMVDYLNITSDASPGQTKSVVRYCAISRSWAGNASREMSAALVQLTMVFHFDDNGATSCIERFFRPISAAQYSSAQAATPHLCRPMSAVMLGDARSGTELLQEYEFERRCPMSNLARLPVYQRRLQAMGAFFRATSARHLAVLSGGDESKAAFIRSQLRCAPSPGPRAAPQEPDSRGQGSGSGGGGRKGAKRREGATATSVAPSVVVVAPGQGAGAVADADGGRMPHAFLGPRDQQPAHAREHAREGREHAREEAHGGGGGRAGARADEGGKAAETAEDAAGRALRQERRQEEEEQDGAASEQREATWGNPFTEEGADLGQELIEALGGEGPPHPLSHDGWASGEAPSTPDGNEGWTLAGGLEEPVWDDAEKIRCGSAEWPAGCHAQTTC